MAETCDILVVGAGVVGASTAFHLAKLGGMRVIVIDKESQIAAGGTGKSCAIVRSHYSVPSNTALTLRSIEMFDNFQDWLEDPEAASGFLRCGYLILAPEGGFTDKMHENLRMQADVGAETYEMSRAEATEQHPYLALDDVALIAYEPRSGYADPHLTTASFIRAARRKGVDVRTNCGAHRLLLKDGRVKGVYTDAGTIEAGHVVCALGPWSPTLLADVVPNLPLDISRHKVLTFRSEKHPYGAMLPVVKDLTANNKIYFRPYSGNRVLAGTGDYGDPVSDPNNMSEHIDTDFVLYQGGLLGKRMPALEEAAPIDRWVGPYDITPDWNPVLGSVDGCEGLTVAFGFSGHGFKLAPAVGLALAQEICGWEQDVDTAPYRLSRFTEGRLLRGAYGAGSIA